MIFLADKNKSVQNEFNEDGALIALTDENGKEVVFEILGVVDYDNDEFAVLIENSAKADFYLTVGKFFVWRSLWIY